MVGSSRGLADSPDPAMIEAALSVVPGIGVTRILPREDGGLDTLRLELDPDADVIAIVIAVQRVLRLQFGVGLDPEPGPRFDTEVLASVARHPAGISGDAMARAPDRPGQPGVLGVLGLRLSVHLTCELGALTGGGHPDSPACRTSSLRPRLVPPLPL